MGEHRSAAIRDLRMDDTATQVAVGVFDPTYAYTEAARAYNSMTAVYRELADVTNHLVIAATNLEHRTTVPRWLLYWLSGILTLMLVMLLFIWLKVDALGPSTTPLF